MTLTKFEVKTVSFENEYTILPVQGSIEMRKVLSISSFMKAIAPRNQEQTHPLSERMRELATTGSLEFCGLCSGMLRQAHS
jgi:hypothetical protein